MSHMEQNETVNIAVEEVEETAGPVVETTTVVNQELVHLLAKIAARREKKLEKRRPLYNLLGAGMLLLAAYFAYTWFISKTNTTRGPVIIALLMIMAILLLRYINTPAVDFMEERMKPYLGQSWNYILSDKGIQLTLNGREGMFQWEELTGWWMEDGYYMMEIGGQSIAIRQENLEQDEEEDLKELLYIYLGEAMPAESGR